MCRLSFNTWWINGDPASGSAAKPAHESKPRPATAAKAANSSTSATATRFRNQAVSLRVVVRTLNQSNRKSELACRIRINVDIDLLTELGSGLSELSCMPLWPTNKYSGLQV